MTTLVPSTTLGAIMELKELFYLAAALLFIAVSYMDRMPDQTSR